jgi:hypothetical protein
MNVDKNGSYLNEPSISEEALKKRIEFLVGSVPLNEKTVVERTVQLNDIDQDLDFLRSKKELEASLAHQIDASAVITLRYNPQIRAFEISELIFGLPGTTSLTANLSLDSDTGEYSSCLYASDTDQIARAPVQATTINTLLSTSGLETKVDASTQSELLAELFQTAQLEDELIIRQKATLFESELTDGIVGICSVERVQTYSKDEIIDVIHFMNEVHTDTSRHARVLSVINSHHGSTISAKEVNEDSLADVQSERTLSFDYNTIEKMLADIDRVTASVEQN